MVAILVVRCISVFLNLIYGGDFLCFRVLIIYDFEKGLLGFRRVLIEMNIYEILPQK